MSVIAVANQKGGVGKTTITMNTAGALSELDNRILLIDMDQQANLSSVFVENIYPLPLTISDLLLNNVRIREVIKKTSVPNLDILPSNLSLSDFDARLARDDDAQYLLLEELEEVKSDYDFILIDCPPSLGTVTRIGLVAANFVVIPIEAQEWAVKGLTQILSYIEGVKKRANPELRLLGIVINKYNSRRKVEVTYNRVLKEIYKDKVFKTEFRDNVQYTETCTRRIPITRYLPTSEQAEGGHTVYPGKDIEHVRNTLRHILVPETRQSSSRVIALGPNWQNPWSDVDDLDKPSKWDRPVLIIIPEPLQISEGKRVDALGKWLASHVPEKRNTVRFLLPADGEKGIYQDGELLFCSRCSYLTSIVWRDDSKYRGLKEEFDKPLRDALKKRFDKFAVLRRWNYQQPDQCIFDVERVTVQGGEIPTAVEKSLVEDLFDPAEFQSLVLERAKESCLVGDLLDELTEPPPPDTKDAIPFLGETPIYEEILKIVAQGKIVVNVGGTWVGRLPEHSSDEEALHFIRSRAFRSGQEMRQIQLGVPAAVGGTTVTGPGTQPPVLPPQPPTGGSTQPPLVPPITPPTTPVDPVPPVTGTTEVHRTDEATTGINLSACFEKWGVDPSAVLDTAKIELNNLTVQQVKQILTRLPSSFKASMEVAFTKEGDEK